jgi:hypothetical protein
VLDDQDGDAAPADPLDRGGEGVQLVRARTGGQLVDEQYLRLRREGCGERDEAPL